MRSRSRVHGNRLDPAILEAALIGLEAKRSAIDEQIARVRSLLGTRSAGQRGQPTGGAAPGTRRRLSAAARRKMSLASKRRWAKVRKEKAGKKAGADEAPSVAQAPKKRRMSAAGRRRIVEANKKRWAKFWKEKRAKKAGA